MRSRPPGTPARASASEPARAVEVRPRPAEPALAPTSEIPGGEVRVVWIAIVECGRGRPKRAWDSLFDPCRMAY